MANSSNDEDFGGIGFEIGKQGNRKENRDEEKERQGKRERSGERARRWGRTEEGEGFYGDERIGSIERPADSAVRRPQLSPNSRSILGTGLEEGHISNAGKKIENRDPLFKIFEQLRLNLAGPADFSPRQARWAQSLQEISSVAPSDKIYLQDLVISHIVIASSLDIAPFSFFSSSFPLPPP